MNITYFTSNGQAYKTIEVNTGLIISGTIDVSSTRTNMFITSKSVK